MFSTSLEVVAKDYGVSTEVSLLGLSLYILGFATGPSLWAPTSELRGRRLPLTISMFGFSLFSMAVATAKDLQTILICRFWAGFFAACPISVVPAVFSDMFSNSSRGLAITVFAMIVFAGPLMAPFIGGFYHLVIPWLALDSIYQLHRGICGIWIDRALSQRNLSTGHSRRESCRASETYQKLGNPCQTRGD